MEKFLHENQKFDLVVLCHVLEHIPDDDAFLKKVGRLMHTSSVLYIEVPWFDTIALEKRPFWYRQNDHFREYTKRALYQLVSSVGYSILSHEDSLNDEGNEPYQFLLAKLPLTANP